MDEYGDVMLYHNLSLCDKIAIRPQSPENARWVLRGGFERQAPESINRDNANVCAITATLASPLSGHDADMTEVKRRTDQRR